jgi:hypothetical protein
MYEPGGTTQTKSHLPTTPVPTTRGSGAQNDFQDASAILDSPECFGGALWDAEMSLAFDAKQEIKEAPEANRKAVFQKHMRNLREGMGAEIERWAPRYLELAAAYPRLTTPDAFEWVRNRMQMVIDKRLRKPNLDGLVAFFLIAMSGGDVTEKHDWVPPQWLCAPREMLLTIVVEHNWVVRRLKYILKRTLAALKVDTAINRGMLQSKNWAGSSQPLGPKLKSGLRRAIAACLALNPDSTDKEIHDWLRQNSPTEIPASWSLDESLPGKTFTKVRKIRKDHETLSTATTRR